jgi:hypothetical protein
MTSNEWYSVAGEYGKATGGGELLAHHHQQQQWLAPAPEPVRGAPSAYTPRARQTYWRALARVALVALLLAVGVVGALYCVADHVNMFLVAKGREEHTLTQAHDALALCDDPLVATVGGDNVYVRGMCAEARRQSHASPLLVAAAEVMRHHLAHFDLCPEHSQCRFLLMNAITNMTASLSILLVVVGVVLFGVTALAGTALVVYWRHAAAARRDVRQCETGAEHHAHAGAAITVDAAGAGGGNPLPMHAAGSIGRRLSHQA